MVNIQSENALKTSENALVNIYVSRLFSIRYMLKRDRVGWMREQDQKNPRYAVGLKYK